MALSWQLAVADLSDNYALSMLAVARGNPTRQRRRRLFATARKRFLGKLQIDMIDDRRHAGRVVELACLL